ncbi:MAG: hypothetical protein AAFW74_06155 [Pseudomonadota bacterium]
MSRSEFAVAAFDPWTQRADRTALIKVFDGHGKLQGDAYGRLRLRLSKGLYTVRIERLGEMTEQVIIHDRDTKARIDVPRRHSAMPMSDTVHTHEFMQEAATKYSRIATFEQSKANREWPRLMIMIRADGGDPDQQVDLSENLVLYDEDGQVVTRFEANRTRQHPSRMFVVFSAQLVAGNYLLSRMGSERMEILPLTLFDRWDTFAFVPYRSRPRLSHSSIKLTKRGRGYDANDQLSKQIDAAMQGLGNHLELLPPRERQNALHGKFRHPLIGLIGAYSHFLNPNRRERLERQVLRNLWRLLPGSTDVIAVLLMALDREEGRLPVTVEALDHQAELAFGEPIGSLLPLTFPPLLSTGLSAIIRASQELSGLIKQDSWLDAAANSSLGAGVWSLWDQPMMDGPREGVSEQTSQAPYVEVALPSTQKIYPALKRALANVSQRAVDEILASTELEQFIEPTSQTMRDLIVDVDNHIEEYTLQIPMPYLRGVKTVRDLANKVRERARPAAERDANAGAQATQLRPVTQIADWLINAVHERIIPGSEFDAGAIARQLAVPKSSVERAVIMSPSSRSGNFNQA